MVWIEPLKAAVYIECLFGVNIMFPVNCPKTRNEEFGQLLEALTEKYCQTVMKLDELIGQFDTLKDKNDKVIKFQDENFSKHDNGIEDVVAQHRWRKHYEIAFCNISFQESCFKAGGGSPACVETS